MARKSKKTNNIIMMMAGGLGGLLVSKLATQNVGFLQSNPLIAGAVKVGAGAYAASMGSPALLGAGVAVGVDGAATVVNSFVPNLGIAGFEAAHLHTVHRVANIPKGYTQANAVG